MYNLDAFLSIDLDYWRDFTQAKGFLEGILALDTPCVVVRLHDSLVPYVNASGCNTLINIDFHDDLVGYANPKERIPALEEGTWVSHIKWAHKGHYIWCYPIEDSLTLGICDGYEDLWLDNKSPWSSIERREGISLECYNVRSVGISLSPFWWRGRKGDFEKLVGWLTDYSYGLGAPTKMDMTEAGLGEYSYLERVLRRSRAMTITA